MQLIDQVNDGKELVKTEDSDSANTPQASMLSGLTDKAITCSQKKVSGFCVLFTSGPLIRQVHHAGPDVFRVVLNLSAIVDTQ